MPEQIASKPSGETLCTMGPAKNRSTNMIAEVYTNTHPACIPSSLIAGVIRSVIQLSVPNSVVASGIMISNNIMKQRLTKAFCIQSKQNSNKTIQITLNVVDQPNTAPN